MHLLIVFTISYKFHWSATKEESNPVFWNKKSKISSETVWQILVWKFDCAGLNMIAKHFLRATVTTSMPRPLEVRITRRGCKYLQQFGSVWRRAQRNMAVAAPRPRWPQPGASRRTPSWPPPDRQSHPPTSLPTDRPKAWHRPRLCTQPRPGPPMQTLTDQSIPLLCFHYVSPCLVRAVHQSNATVVTLKEQYLETLLAPHLKVQAAKVPVVNVQKQPWGRKIPNSGKKKGEIGEFGGLGGTGKHSC